MRYGDSPTTSRHETLTKIVQLPSPLPIILIIPAKLDIEIQIAHRGAYSDPSGPLGSEYVP